MPQETSRYTNQRAKKTPPHISLSVLRGATGLTIQAVIDRISEETGRTYTRGAISAIESGLRGASQQTLADLELAYGIPSGSISTTFVPRKASSVQAAAS